MHQELTQLEPLIFKCIAPDNNLRKMIEFQHKKHCIMFTNTEVANMFNNKRATL